MNGKFNPGNQGLGQNIFSIGASRASLHDRGRQIRQRKYCKGTAMGSTVWLETSLKRKRSLAKK